MKYLMKYLKGYRFESIIAPLFKMLEAGFDLCVPLIVADIIDEGIKNGDKAYILCRFALLVGMAALGLLCSVIAQYFAAKTAIGAASTMRHDIFTKIQSLSFSELDKVGTSTLITRMTSDVNQVQNGINMFLRLFLRSPFIVFGAMVLAFFIDVELALIFVGAIVILFIIVFGIMCLTSPKYKAVQGKLDKITEATTENIGGVRVIRAFGREDVQGRIFKDINEEILREQIGVGRISALMNPLTYVVVNAVIIAVLWLGREKVDSGVLLSGAIIALINYIGQILVELVKLANLIVLLSKAMAGMSRISQILDMESSMVYSGEADFSCTDEAVRFENVSLKYHGGGDEAVSNISFSANKGEVIGIIGGTGSGKSTLVNMIPRFYDATSGTVYIKGTPVKDISREKLNDTVSIVSQKATLFSGTVRSNLLWGKNDASDEEIWQVLGVAQAKEFVEKKPLLLDEEIKEGGVNLSGGQRQRLTIARAILKGADILILDDSSSALDYATDAALRHALKTLSDSVTVFIVSQRASSVSHADKILVLDDGELVGVGKHDELLATCEVYREIYESQSAEGRV